MIPTQMSSLAFVAGQFLRERTYPARFQYRLRTRLARWSIPIERREQALRDAVHALTHTAPYPHLPKGAPDVAGMKRELARRVAGAFAQLDSSEAAPELLRQLRWAAAVDGRDAVAFEAFGLAFQQAHRDMLEALTRSLSPAVVLHLSCVPRLPRARQSVDSFAGAALSHLTVVGDRSSALFSFDPDTHVLRVPCGDGYSQLPMKVVSAYFILALVPQVRTVLKLDDDHRLGDLAELQAALSECARTGAPTLFGRVDRAGYYAGHNRGWHFGKCADDPANAEPFAFPGVLAWVGGAYGYVLNRRALRSMTWAYTYFARHVESALYEDQLVSDLVVRLGGRLRPLATDRFLTTVSAY